MEHVGYDLVDADGTIVASWGDTIGQCAGVPNVIRLPNGDQVHCPRVGDDYGGFKLVPRMKAAVAGMI